MRDRLVRVQAALVVLRASLDTGAGRLADNEALAVQVPALALARLLEQACERASMQADTVPVFSEVKSELMQAQSLFACLDAALCRASEGSTKDMRGAMTPGDVFETCALLEDMLADVLGALRDAADLAAEGGAA